MEKIAAFTGSTIGTKLDRNRGLGPGFDFARITLAISVIAIHAQTIATGDNWFSSRVMWFPEYAILVMFFALSGFLITGSAQRLSLRDFMINRGLRIFPALAVEVGFSAFVVGSLTSDLPIADYFSRIQTYHYLTNIVGWINYYLPGVFEKNPKAVVNGSLWTVPYELGCYAIMGSLMIFKALGRRATALIILAAFLLMGFISPLIVQALGSHGIADQVLRCVFIDRGSKLYVAFLFGIVAYLYRERIPYDRRIFGLCSIFCIGLSLLRPAVWMTVPLLNALVAPAVIYITIFIGATRVPRLPVYGMGDYSYGIYLYAYPIQQMVRTYLPFAKNPVAGFSVSLILVTFFAMFSWHFIEKPLLKQRKRFSFVARARGVEGPGESLVSAPPPIIDPKTGEALTFGPVIHPT
jgi:peptidoglycan/LPS O-acetylase OafA/YrhL